MFQLSLQGVCATHTDTPALIDEGPSCLSGVEKYSGSQSVRERGWETVTSQKQMGNATLVE